MHLADALGVLLEALGGLFVDVLHVHFNMARFHKLGLRFAFHDLLLGVFRQGRIVELFLHCLDFLNKVFALFAHLGELRLGRFDGGVYLRRGFLSLVVFGIRLLHVHHEDFRGGREGGASEDAGEDDCNFLHVVFSRIRFY